MSAKAITSGLRYAALLILGLALLPLAAACFALALPSGGLLLLGLWLAPEECSALGFAVMGRLRRMGERNQARKAAKVKRQRDALIAKLVEDRNRRVARDSFLVEVPGSVRNQERAYPPLARPLPPPPPIQVITISDPAPNVRVHEAKRSMAVPGRKA